MSGNVSSLTEGSVLRIRLNRPDRRNAFDDELIANLTEAFARVGTEPGVRVVILEAEGSTFCAGADVAWMRRMAGYSEEENLADTLRMAEMFRAIAECQRPVVARVQGAALGGGSGLVAACDIAIASSETVFGFTEVRLGIIPAVISPFVLTKVHPGALRRYFLTGERFDAAEALRIGLIQGMVGAGDLDHEIARLVGELLACGPVAQSEAKRLLRELPGLAQSERARTTAAWTARLRASEEGREGLAAFLERRPPAWREGPAS